MDKAFDTVCRSKLLTDLQEILEPDAMHVMAVLISDVVLTVKVGKELGEQVCIHQPRNIHIGVQLHVTMSCNYAPDGSAASHLHRRTTLVLARVVG